MIFTIICAAIIALCIGYMIGYSVHEWKSRETHPDWSPIAISVVDMQSYNTYNADRVDISNESTPYLRIYNYNWGCFEWKPIWHFKNPFLIMLAINPQYAKTHLLQLNQKNAE